MAYTPTEWKCGDVVTAEALNKIEQGIANSGGGGALVVHVVVSNNPDPEGIDMIYTYDKTGAEIIEALQSHKSVVFHQTFDGDDYNGDWFYPTKLMENGADWLLQIGSFSYNTRGYSMNFSILQININGGEITNTYGYEASAS